MTISNVVNHSVRCSTILLKRKLRGVITSLTNLIEVGKASFPRIYQNVHYLAAFLTFYIVTDMLCGMHAPLFFQM